MSIQPSEPSETAPKQPIPQREFFNIEYPGRMSNVDRAFENLGGVQLLQRRFRQENPEIELKFRPKDPFSHGISGNVVNTRNLLLKVTRQVKKSDPSVQVGDYNAEIIGNVTKTCRFRDMADYQFLVPPENRIVAVKKAVIDCDVNRMMDFEDVKEDDYDNLELVPPPLFSRLAIPFEYGYQQNQAVIKVKVRQPDGSIAIRMVNRYKQRKVQAYLVQWGATSIPDKPPPQLRPFGDDATKVLQLVTKLFEERPIWTRFALRGRLPPSTHKYMSSVMPVLSYNMLSGPWRDTWILYGFDPRREPDTYQYQILDHRQPGKTKNEILNRQQGKRTQMESNEATANSEPSYENDNPHMDHQWDGVGHPQRVNNFMLCDLLLPEVQDTIHNPKYRKATCTKESGWIYPSIFRDLRKFTKAAIAAGSKDERLPSLQECEVDFDASLKQDIEAEKQASQKMDEDSALEEAASAGPDVSARVIELMRNLQKTQDFEDEYELDELQEYEDVFGDDDDEENRMDQSDEDEDQIDELEDED
ncbi:tau 95 subunit of transcription factor TFIIIC [Umbelopsis nana]